MPSLIHQFSLGSMLGVMGALLAGPVTIPLVLGWPLAGLRAEGEGPAVRLLSLFLLAP